MDWNRLPPELGEAHEALPSLVAEVETKLPYAAALLARNSGLQIRITNREQQVTETQPKQGLVLSGWNGAFFEEAATSDLTRQHMFELARQFARNVEVRPSARAM